MPLITPEQGVEIALKDEHIIPDVVDKFHTKTVLMVSYNGRDVMLGNTLAVADTQHEPKISFLADSPTDKYTLIMTDPDAPSRQEPKMREWRHWAVSDVSVAPTSSDFIVNIKGGKTLTPYMGPAPPKGSGPHRYVFLLYKQTPSSDMSVLATPLSANNRGKFKASQFANQAKIELVGANFFFAENK